MKTARKVVVRVQMMMPHSNYKPYQAMVCISASIQLGVPQVNNNDMYSAFELSCGRVVTRVYVTTTGDKVYGFLPRESEQGRIQ